MKKNPLANRSGVYAIRCLPTDKYYVGFSTNVGRRILTHFASLRRNSHSNSALQSDFIQFGESSFLPRLVLESYDSAMGYQLEANLIKMGGEDTYNVIESKKISNELYNRKGDFFKRCEQRGDCLEWVGKRSPQGYGVFSYYMDGKRYYVQAHRAAYFLAYEDPFSSRISHTCDNNYCVTPEHLVLGVLNAIGPQEVKQIVSLYNKGISIDKIATKLSVSQTGVIEVIRRNCGLRMQDALVPGCLSTNDIIRFKSKISKRGNCHHFDAAPNSRGYPTFTWEFGDRKRNTFAYRVAYFIEHGECPDELSRLCDDPFCVNPDHLQECE